MPHSTKIHFYSWYLFYNYSILGCRRKRCVSLAIFSFCVSFFLFVCTVHSGELSFFARRTFALPEIRWLPDGYTVWYKRTINCMVITVKHVHFYYKYLYCTGTYSAVRSGTYRSGNNCMVSTVKYLHFYLVRIVQML